MLYFLKRCNCEGRKQLQENNRSEIYGIFRIAGKNTNPFFGCFFSILHLSGTGYPGAGGHLYSFLVCKQKAGLPDRPHLFASGLLLQNLKITFRLSGPVLNPEFQAVESAIPAATGYSFPSGHTQTATALYSSLALYTKKKEPEDTALPALSIGRLFPHVPGMSHTQRCADSHWNHSGCLHPSLSVQ